MDCTCDECSYVRSSGSKTKYCSIAADGYRFIEPSEGFLACGYVGKGRLEEPEKITALVLGYFSPRVKPLAGKTVLVTTGACSVPLDDKHVISTNANGEFGKAIAAEANRLGAHVQVFEEELAQVLVEKVESYKQQYPNPILIHAANMPTVVRTPEISVEQTAMSVTFGQQIIGDASYNVESTNWIETSNEAIINGQLYELRDAAQFAKALWSLLLEGETE